MSRRIKQNFYTAIGIALSFLIAFGGWIVTRELLDKKEKALFAVTGSIQVNTPIITAAETSKNQDGEESIETEYISPKLTDSQITSVLQNWENDGVERPHEPMVGQLNMEQAIEAAKDGLKFFYEQGFIPENFHDEYNKINANLCVKQLGDQRTQTFEPYYSYWTVLLTGDKTNSQLIINAVTGQIWRADVTLLPQSGKYYKIETDERSMEHIVDSFISYLDLGSNADTFKTSKNTVSKDIANDSFYVIAQKNDMNVIADSILSIYLSAQRPE